MVITHNFSFLLLIIITDPKILLCVCLKQNVIFLQILLYYFHWLGWYNILVIIMFYNWPSSIKSSMNLFTLFFKRLHIGWRHHDSQVFTVLTFACFCMHSNFYFRFPVFRICCLIMSVASLSAKFLHVYIVQHLCNPNLKSFFFCPFVKRFRFSWIYFSWFNSSVFFTLNHPQFYPRLLPYFFPYFRVNS
jgi:hypothetical protein